MGWTAQDKKALTDPEDKPQGGYAVIYLPNKGQEGSDTDDD